MQSKNQTSIPLAGLYLGGFVEFGQTPPKLGRDLSSPDVSLWSARALITGAIVTESNFNLMALTLHALALLTA